MTAARRPGTEIFVVSVRPAFYEAVREAAGAIEGIRVAFVAQDRGPDLLKSCLEVLERREAAVLLIDTEGHVEERMLLIQEISERQRLSRVLVAGPTEDSSLILKCQRAGASDYIPLPVTRENLVESIGRLWRRLGADAQASRQRSGRIFHFLGSKGGCGTTTVATNLAAVLAKAGRSTLLLDLDKVGTDIALLLDLKPAFTVIDVLESSHRLDRDLLNGMILKHDSGLCVLPSDERLGKASSLDGRKLEQLLHFVRDQFDCVVVNTRDAADPVAETTWSVANVVHLVTTLDLLSLRRAQWSLQKLSQAGVPKEPLRLVLNRCEKNGSITREDAERVLGMKAAWCIPTEAAAVQESLERAVPFATHGRTSLQTNFNDYASELLGVPIGEPAAGGRSKVLPRWLWRKAVPTEAQTEGGMA